MTQEWLSATYNQIYECYSEVPGLGRAAEHCFKNILDAMCNYAFQNKSHLTSASFQKTLAVNLAVIFHSDSLFVSILTLHLIFATKVFMLQNITFQKQHHLTRLLK